MLRAVSRGVALAGDLVIVARLDAKLVALNRADGKQVWEATIDDWKRGVTTNAAPLVVKDRSSSASLAANTACAAI